MNAITVRNLEKEYKTHKRKPGLVNAFKSLFRRDYVVKRALKGISFEVGQGEILGLIGPNGAGKSTTIKALSGVIYPTSGVVDVLGYVPWKERIKYVANIGVVLGQKPQLYWDIPAIDTFYLHKELYGIPDREFRERLAHMTRLLEIEDIQKTPVRDLSLGERMKCKIVAALLHAPKLVFLDEPTIGLDVVAKDRLRDFIIDTNRRYRTTFIITTHDMLDIERLCKRVVIINHGDVVYDGLLSQIQKDFMTKKVIDVKFEQFSGRFKLPGCKVLRSNKYELKIEVDLKKQKVRNVVDHLVSKYHFVDLVVSDMPIEEIIQKIFKEGR